jgi:hypothetical protein
MNFNLILEGKKEFYPKLNNKIYNILLVDNSKKITFMIEFFSNFIKSQKKNINVNHFLGCDFEFNKVSKEKKEVALFQINCEKDNDDIGYIFIFKPSEIDFKQQTILIELLTDENIIKILHGGESLDIPFLFDQLLKTETNIKKFCKKLFDTKYLCEFYHLQNKKNSKCSIYFMLEELKIITASKIKDFERIEKNMGPIYLIDINIHKLSNDLLKYSLYDVLFLPELIKKFLKMNYIYTDLIPDITSFVFQYKRLDNHFFNNLKNEVNSFNIHFIKNRDNIYFLNDVFNYYLWTLSFKDYENLINITYFKESIEILFKYIVYKKIQKIQDIYKNKSIIASKLKEYNFNEYPILKDLLNKLNLIIEKN